jgi:AcrR family transcriptional regulator
MISREARPSTEDTRERIFAAAREIFAVRGPHGTTTREIADRAGVNEATLFRHFGNKSSLLDAMKEYFCESNEARIRGVFDTLGGTDLEADLRVIAANMVAGMQRNIDLIRATMLEEAADPEAAHAPWRAPNVARDYLTRFLEKYVESGELQGRPEILARVFMGMFFSYIMGRGFWNESVLTDERAVETFVGIFLNGSRSKQ